MIAFGFYSLFILWFLFWFFIASRASGQVTVITEGGGQRQVETHYESVERFGPDLFLVIVVGLLGGVAGSTVSVILRYKSDRIRLIGALAVSPIVAVCVALVLYGVFFGFRVSPDTEFSHGIIPLLAALLSLFIGTCIFAGFPAVLCGIATLFVFSGEDTVSSALGYPPPPPKAHEL